MDEQVISEGLKALFDRRGQFIVLGLTGRTGSGCTTSVELLSKEFSDLRLEPVASPLLSPEQRKHRVISEFAEKNWQPFVEVSVTLIIVTFVLEEKPNELESFLKAHVRDRDLPQLMTEIAKQMRLSSALRSAPPIQGRGRGVFGTRPTRYRGFQSSLTFALSNRWSRPLQQRVEPIHRMSTRMKLNSTAPSQGTSPTAMRKPRTSMMPAG